MLPAPKITIGFGCAGFAHHWRRVFGSKASVMMENFLHHCPPLALFPGCERLLAWHADGPPFLIFRIVGHLLHVGLKIGADIFPCAEQQVFRLFEKDRIVGDVALEHERQNFRPHGSLQRLIFCDLLAREPDHHAHSLNHYALPISRVNSEIDRACTASQSHSMPMPGSDGAMARPSRISMPLVVSSSSCGIYST